MGANAQTSVPTFTAGQVLTATQMNDSARTGVPVFVDASARDAGFGGTGEKTLAEGQLAYLEGVGLQSYNGSSWVTWGTAPASGGLVPMVPTSVAKTGASSTATASANGHVSFTLCETLLLNDVFTSAYANYRIVFTGFGSTGLSMNCRLSVGGSPSSAASYNRQRLIATSTTVAGLRSTGQTSWEIAANIDTTGGDNLSMDIFNPQATANTSFNVLSLSTVSSSYWQSAGGYFNATTSFDGIQLLASTGNISGIVSVYGYNQ